MSDIALLIKTNHRKPRLSIEPIQSMATIWRPLASDYIAPFIFWAAYIFPVLKNPVLGACSRTWACSNCRKGSMASSSSMVVVVNTMVIAADEEGIIDVGSWLKRGTVYSRGYFILKRSSSEQRPPFLWPPRPSASEAKRSEVMGLGFRSILVSG